MPGASRHGPPFLFHDHCRGPCQRSSLDFVFGAAVSPPAPSAYHHTRPSERQSTSCVNELWWKCECVRVSEHNRTRHFTLDHFLELFFCIYDLVSTVTVDNVHQTVRTLVDMTPQWADVVLASDAPTRSISSSYTPRSPHSKPLVRKVVTTLPSFSIK